MIVLRLLLVLLAMSSVLSLALYFLTGKISYLLFFRKIWRVTLLFCIVLTTLVVIERLILI